jgi:hypothetical protein
MQASVINLLEKYLGERSPESFLRLREAVAGSPEYAPYTDSPNNVLSTVPAGDYEKARSALLPLMSGWLLNPGIHTLLSVVFYKLGDEDGARVEFELGARCLEGILSTGTGEQASPYLVLHTADEYDVLEHLGKKSVTQGLVTTEQKTVYDVHKCEDGTSLWFDVTIPYTLMAEALERKT